MGFGRVPWLGLWSRTGGGLRYICIEPWFGVDDEAIADRQLIHKTGIQRLAQGEEFAMDIGIHPFLEKEEQRYG